MSDRAKMSKRVSDRIQWIKSKYTNFNVEDRFIPYLECAEKNAIAEETGDDDGDEWVKVKDPQDLLDLAPITHELWSPNIEEDPEQWQAVIKDVNDGVTFAFYWQEDALCWER